MAGLISAAFTWGPTLYYVHKICQSNIASYKTAKYTPTKAYADKMFPELHLQNSIPVFISHQYFQGKALGSTIGLGAIIMVNEDLFKANEQAFRAVCKREISHIQSDDEIIASTLAVIASHVSKFAIPYLLDCLPWWVSPIAHCLPMFAADNTFKGTMGYSDRKADAYFLKHATKEELVASQALIASQITVHKELQVKYPHLFLANGNACYEIPTVNVTIIDRLFHALKRPDETFIQRLSNVEAELRKRSVSQRATNEESEKLKSFHRHNYSRMKLKVD